MVQATLAGAAAACLSGCAAFTSHPTRYHAPLSRGAARGRPGAFEARRVPLASSRHEHGSTSLSHAHQCRSSTSLSMGLLDFLNEKFLDAREGDFVPLDDSDDDVFGPGPLVLLYAVPEAMDDAEFLDMLADGMPNRAKEGVIIRRVAPMDDEGQGGDALLDLSVGEALDEAMKTKPSAPTPAQPAVSASTEGPCPVLYFSGVSNSEMMDTYRIIANEIYDETGGVHWPACAKAVEPAMGKSLRRVLGEISGDHEEAMKMRREEAEGGG